MRKIREVLRFRYGLNFSERKIAQTGQPVLILLWYTSLVGLNAWIAGGLRQPGIWLRSGGLVLSQLVLGLGLAVAIWSLISVFADIQ
jgi:hypothetical protein